jgi:hypothetical protein
MRTFDGPPQRVHRRPARRRFDQPIQSVLQSRLGDRVRFATTTNLSLPMARKWSGIIKFLQPCSNGAIRQPRGQSNRRDSTMPQSPRFDRCPTPPTAFVQIVEQFDILAFNGFYDCRILHDAIMTLTADWTQAQFR